MVLPKTSLDEGRGGSIRDQTLDIGRKGQIGTSKTKNSSVKKMFWFPGMDDQVKELVYMSLPCLAVTET